MEDLRERVAAPEIVASARDPGESEREGRQDDEKRAWVRRRLS
ncbi:hypothetical protein AZE42_11045 [Rhizopogon vesiculosus]|uniref:Uncharacterized protein n=1 Tax=Rhizopogon vesiculosus TaxID=180088 RepID=A0A1J8Q6P0_9AGAM|nr:hypothetical protein AZE42_11045 [Rhizopogon vesiculosus]